MSQCQPSNQTNKTCISKGADASPQPKQTKPVSARERMHVKQTSLCTFLLELVIHFFVETCDARILLGTVTQPVEWGAPSDPTNYHVLLELYSSHVCRLPSVDRIRCHKPNISMTSANAAIWLVEILTHIHIHKLDARKLRVGRLFRCRSGSRSM